MEKITLESLIEEQKARIPQLRYVPSPRGCIGFAYYCYDNSEEYQKWLAKTSRFIGINFPNDRDVLEFEEISKEKLSPSQQQRLLAILEAFSCLPTVICKKDNKNTVKQDGITVNTNINNTNSQSQSQEQSMAIEMFLEAIKDDLTGRQIKKIKEVMAESGNDKEKARDGIIAKLKSFGSNVASSIVANIITNPLIWSSL